MTNLDDKTRDMWKDIYILRDKRQRMGDTPDEWSALYKDALAISIKYNNTDEIVKLACAVIEIMESKLGHRFGGGG